MMGESPRYEIWHREAGRASSERGIARGCVVRLGFDDVQLASRRPPPLAAWLSKKERASRWAKSDRPRRSGHKGSSDSEPRRQC